MNTLDKIIREYFSARNIPLENYYPYSLKLGAKSNKEMSLLFFIQSKNITEIVPMELEKAQMEDFDKHIEEKTLLILEKVYEQYFINDEQ